MGLGHCGGRGSSPPLAMPGVLASSPALRTLLEGAIVHLVVLNTFRVGAFPRGQIVSELLRPCRVHIGCIIGAGYGLGRAVVQPIKGALPVRDRNATGAC